MVEEHALPGHAEEGDRLTESAGTSGAAEVAVVAKMKTAEGHSMPVDRLELYVEDDSGMSLGGHNSPHGVPDANDRLHSVHVGPGLEAFAIEEPGAGGDRAALHWPPPHSEAVESTGGHGGGGSGEDTTISSHGTLHLIDDALHDHVMREMDMSATDSPATTSSDGHAAGGRMAPDTGDTAPALRPLSSGVDSARPVPPAQLSVLLPCGPVLGGGGGGGSGGGGSTGGGGGGGGSGAHDHAAQLGDEYKSLSATEIQLLQSSGILAGMMSLMHTHAHLDVHACESEIQLLRSSGILAGCVRLGAHPPPLE